MCEENKHLPVRDRLAPVHVDKIAHNLLGRKQRLVHNLCFAFLSLRKKNHLVHAKLVKRESCRRSPMWWRLMIRWAGPVVDLIITFLCLHPLTDCSATLHRSCHHPLTDCVANPHLSCHHPLTNPVATTSRIVMPPLTYSVANPHRSFRHPLILF